MSRYNEASKELDRLNSSGYFSRKSSPHRSNGKYMEITANRGYSSGGGVTGKYRDVDEDEDDEAFYNMNSSTFTKSHLSTSYSARNTSGNNDSYLTRDMPNRSTRKFGSNPNESDIGNLSHSRQFTHLDPPKAPNIEYTSYNNYIASKQEANIVNHSSSFEDPSRHASATSVINAFRELQNKVKRIEQEKYQIQQQRDSLKTELYEKKRHYKNILHQEEVNYTESLISMKSKQDSLNSDYNTLTHRYNTQQEANHSLQHQVNSLEYYHQTLQKDVDVYRTKIRNLEKDISVLRDQTHTTNNRVENITQMATTSPKKFHKHEKMLVTKLEKLREELAAVNKGKNEAKNKMISLEHYMNLIIKINQDLCDTLVAREKLKDKILRISGSTSFRSITPPRYAWPKEIPYHNILNVINDAAKLQATAAIENTALEATQQAMNTVINALSPNSPYRKSRSATRSRSASRSVSRSRSASRSVGRSATKSKSPASRSSYYSETNEDEDEDANLEDTYGDNITSSLRRLSLDQLHQSFADNHQATLEQVSALHGHAAALKNSLAGSSNNTGHHTTSTGNVVTPRKSISFEDEVRRAPGVDQNGEEDETTRKKPTPTYSSTAELLTNQSKSPNRRYLNDQDDDDDDDDEDYVPPTSEEDDDDDLDLGETMYEDELKATKRSGRRQSDGGEVKKVKGKKKKKKGTDGLIGRSRSSSATGGRRSRSRSRNESMLSRQMSTMDKIIARHGAITSATRLAAAANAASVTTKLHNTPSPTRVTGIPAHSSLLQPTISSLLSRSDVSFQPSIHVMQTRAQKAYDDGNIHGSKLPSNKVNFIPSSGTSSAEFNIVASVSKASRAAKSLNATLASKVKSLHNDGSGVIFQEVPRIDLEDLQHQLKVVKKMKESFR